MNDIEIQELVLQAAKIVAANDIDLTDAVDSIAIALNRIAAAMEMHNKLIDDGRPL